MSYIDSCMLLIEDNYGLNIQNIIDFIAESNKATFLYFTYYEVFLKVDNFLLFISSTVGF